jgi:hypothetical protein
MPTSGTAQKQHRALNGVAPAIADAAPGHLPPEPASDQQVTGQETLSLWIRHVAAMPDR